MCNAWNHPSDCTCGWGGDGHSGRGGGGGGWTGVFGDRWQPERTWIGSVGLDSPNAHCPVCQDPVFFIRPRNGGCVWLDELPPWTKHPCMVVEDRRTRFPNPLTEPSTRDIKVPPQGWLRHVDHLNVTRDGTWDCYYFLLEGMQVATATELLPALSPYYLSWAPPARFYGSLQYLAKGKDGPEVIDVHVCSYGVMRRARLAPRSSHSKADWEALQAWVWNLQGFSPQHASDLIRLLKTTIELLSPGWSYNVEMSRIVRVRIEEVCRTIPNVDHNTLFKWVRLFLG